ncbi:MAG: type II secretion system protein GspG [Planctomycetota bacterium]
MASRLPFLLLTAVLSCSPVERSARDTVAGFLPENTIFFCMVEDLDGLRAAFRESSLGRMMVEDGVREFFKRPCARFADWWKLVDGIPLEGIFDGETRQVFVAVIPSVSRVRSGVGAEVVVGWEGESLPAFLAAPKMHRKRVHGIKVFSSSKKALARLGTGDEGRLGEKKSFQAACRQVQVEEAGLFLFLDLARMVDGIGELDPPDSVERGLKGITPLSFDAVAATLELRDGRSHTKVYLSDGPAAARVRRLSPEATFTAGDLRLVPEEALAAQFFNLSPGAALDLLAEYGLIDAKRLSFEGSDLRSDLLDRLGPRVLVMAPGESLTRPCDWLGSIEVQDAEKATEALVSLVPAVAGQLGLSLSVQPVKEEVCPIYRVVSTEGDAAFGFFAVKGGWLTVAADESVLRQHLVRIERDGSDVAARAVSPEVWSRLTGAGEAVCGIAYCSLPRLARVLSGRADLVAAALSGPFGSDSPFDFSLLPAPELFEKYLLPTVAVSRRLDEGWLFEREGTLGGELTGLGAQSILAGIGAYAAYMASEDGPVVTKLAQGKQNAAKTMIDSIRMAVTCYYMNNNRLPDSLETLTQPDPNYFNEGYIEDKGCLLDPWGRPFIYRRGEGRKFEILSYGADGIPGGEGANADLTSLKPEDR